MNFYNQIKTTLTVTETLSPTKKPRQPSNKCNTISHKIHTIDAAFIFDIHPKIQNNYSFTAVIIIILGISNNIASILKNSIINFGDDTTATTTFYYCHHKW